MRGNQTFHVVQGGFTNHAGELIFVDTLLPDFSFNHKAFADVNGDGAADFGIDFGNGNLTLTATDFIL